MNIISIGTDRKIFEEGSAVRARMVEYGTLFTQLHIVVFVHRSLNLKPQKISDNVWVHPTNSRFKLCYIWDAYRHAGKIIQSIEDKKDIVITVQDPFETGRVGIWLKNKYKLPLQVQVHTDLFSPYFKKGSILNRIRVWNARKILPLADGIRVVSDRIKRSLVEKLHIAQNTIDVLPIFVEKKISSVVAVKKFGAFTTSILMVGRLTREKNISFGLEVFAEVVKKYPQTALVIVGEGPEKNILEHKAQSLGIAHAVIFEPWQHDLTAYYNAADIFMHTSLYEGYGLVLIEAALHRMPILTSDVGIAGDILKNRMNALVSPVNDKKRFVTDLIDLLSSPVLRQQCKERVASDVQLAIITDKSAYLEVYKKLLEKILAKH